MILFLLGAGATGFCVGAALSRRPKRLGITEAPVPRIPDADLARFEAAFCKITDAHNRTGPEDSRERKEYKDAFERLMAQVPSYERKRMREYVQWKCPPKDPSLLLAPVPAVTGMTPSTYRYAAQPPAAPPPLPAFPAVASIETQPQYGFYTLPQPERPAVPSIYRYAEPSQPAPPPPAGEGARAMPSSSWGPTAPSGQTPWTAQAAVSTTPAALPRRNIPSLPFAIPGGGMTYQGGM